MSVKSFFKSTAFKCIVVLLAIVIVCGAFLTICNSLFYVTDAERTNRAIAKIYGKDVNVENVEVPADKATQGDATIVGAYKNTEDGNYIIASKGSGGYQGGTITCYVVVEMSGSSISGVGNVVVSSYDSSQTQIAEITSSSSFLNSFSAGYKADIEYTTDNFVVTGSSKSSNAVCNAVNGALSFVKTAVLGQSASSNPYEEFAYTKYINVSKDGTTGEYYTTYTVEGTEVNYHVKTKASGLDPSPFEMDIVVEKTGDNATIKSYTITKVGTNLTTIVMYDGIENLLIGKTAAEILAIIGTEDGSYDGASISGTVQTSATHSNFLCLYAGLFAVANYDVAISAQGGNS
jgi:hypothetical protein